MDLAIIQVPYTRDKGRYQSVRAKNRRFHEKNLAEEERATAERGLTPVMYLELHGRALHKISINDLKAAIFFNT